MVLKIRITYIAVDGNKYEAVEPIDKDLKSNVVNRHKKKKHVKEIISVENMF